MQSQKEVKSVKKRVRPQKGHCEKRCEIQDGIHDGGLMAKFLIMTI